MSVKICILALFQSFAEIQSISGRCADNPGELSQMRITQNNDTLTKV